MTTVTVRVNSSSMSRSFTASANELQPIVGTDVCWQAAQHKQVRQRLHHGMRSIWLVAPHCVVQELRGLGDVGNRPAAALAKLA